ncbi:MAG: S41 family peptidase [Bacteroidota bacterium]
MIKSFGFPMLLLLLCLGCQPSPPQPTDSFSNKAKATSLSYQERFDEIAEIVENHFFDSLKIVQEFPAIKQRYESQVETIQHQGQFSQLIGEMLTELKTSHTYYLCPSDVEYYWLGELFSRFVAPVQQVFNHQEVKYPSLGLLTQKLDQQTFVASVLPRSPADSVGILAGDEILSINGGPYEPVDSLRAYIGQMVELAIRRKANGEVLYFNPSPQLLNPKDAFLTAQKNSARLIESNGKQIAYIHIYSYAGEEYHDALISAIAYGSLKEADALIIDLRYGIGGADFSYLDIFNTQVPRSISIDRRGEQYTYDTKWRKPAVYLTNGTTRSGKEVLAFGAKQFQLATVIGERTAGEVVAGQIHALSNGDLLYLAVRDVQVEGVRLEGKGVAPDIEVPMDIRYTEGRDIQLESAVHFLVRQTKG